jgi:FkbM family methyltransferase
MKFYGQTYNGAAESTDEFLFRELFSRIPRGFYIECGALNGLSISNCKLLDESLGWSGLNIEPTEAFNELIINRPRNINIKAALGDRDFDKVKFNESVTNLAASSFQVDMINKSYETKEINVVMYTYKTLLEILGISKVDFFSLDVEGYELNVIKGMFGSLALPTYFFIETHYSDKEKIYGLLDELGYERVAFFHLDELFKLRGRDGPSDINSFK